MCFPSTGADSQPGLFKHGVADAPSGRVRLGSLPDRLDEPALLYRNLDQADAGLRARGNSVPERQTPAFNDRATASDNALAPQQPTVRTDEYHGIRVRIHEDRQMVLDLPHHRPRHRDGAPRPTCLGLLTEDHVAADFDRRTRHANP